MHSRLKCSDYDNGAKFIVITTITITNNIGTHTHNPRQCLHLESSMPTAVRRRLNPA